MEVAVLLIVLRQACEVVDISVPRQTSSDARQSEGETAQ